MVANEIDQKYWFKENLSFPCPINATTMHIYLSVQFFNGGPERMISPRKVIELNIQPGSVEFAVRISVACDIDGKPSPITGTTVFPLKEPYMTLKIYNGRAATRLVPVRD